MKFRESDRSTRKVKVNLDLTPLIDVVFQLILFFMLSSTFVVQNSIQIEMPQADGSQQIEHKDLSVTLTVDPGGPDGEGAIFIDNDPVNSWDDLASRLAEEAERRGDQFLLLFRADGRVSTARTVRVMGVARSVGITRFALGAQPLAEEG